MKSHIRKHQEGRKVTTGIPATTYDDGKKRRQMGSSECGNKRENCDNHGEGEKPRIARVFACGLCNTLSPDYGTALVHSVVHTELIISLERVSIH